GRQKFQHKPSREWLTRILADGGQRTTIFLTGSAPYVYGDTKATPLFDDMAQWSETGSFSMWFWGDDHYCALFERNAEKANFVGSCIGHGGFPGDIKKAGGKSYVPVRWLETEARFPSDTKLRQGVANNGFVEMTLLDGGGVELLYIDWLGCERYWARYVRRQD